MTVCDSKQQATKATPNPEFQVQSIGSTKINNGTSKHQQYGERVRKLMQSKNYSQSVTSWRVATCVEHVLSRLLQNISRIHIAMLVFVCVRSYLCVSMFIFLKLMRTCVRVYISLCVRLHVFDRMDERKKERNEGRECIDTEHTHTHTQNISGIQAHTRNIINKETQGTI